MKDGKKSYTVGKGKPPREFQFKPGSSGNPSGRPKMTPQARVMKRLTIESFQECIELVCTGNIAALEEMRDDPLVSALQVGIAASLVRSMKEGDYETIEKIVSRIVGKMPEEFNIRSTNFNANANADLGKEKLKAILAKIDVDI